MFDSDRLGKNVGKSASPRITPMAVALGERWDLEEEELRLLFGALFAAMQEGISATTVEMVAQILEWADTPQPVWVETVPETSPPFTVDGKVHFNISGVSLAGGHVEEFLEGLEELE